MVTALSLTFYIGLITLAPVVCGAVVAILGLAGRITRPVMLALCVIGVLVPAIGLPFLAPELTFGDPITIRPFGLGSGFAQWIVPTYRVDALALYCGIGVAFLVIPLLLWLSFVAAPRLSVVKADSLEPASDEGDAAEREASAAEAHNDHVVSPPVVRAAGVVLALETVALTLIFADNLVLFGVAWVVLVALAWALGEVATDAANADRRGLLAMVVGPVLWLVILLFPATSAHAPRFLDLNGRTAFAPLVCILLAGGLALASGAYPALTWVRRRVALAGPAGLAAIVVAVLPAALYAAARTYAIAVGPAAHWPYFTSGTQPNTTPAPITTGIVLAVLGTATTVVAAVLMLGRRDGRTIIALLATAQIGWGLLAVGLGQPVSLLGLVALLPSMLLGLGAMIASSVAGGALMDDMEVVEPDADGPRPAGAPLRPVALIAWVVGAASLVGVPLLAGFAPRQLITAGGIATGGLTVPLVGLCWAGDILLVLALVRAVAPAFMAIPAQAARGQLVSLADAPGAVLAALALALGVLPGVALQAFSGVATQVLLGPATSSAIHSAGLVGYTVALGQWLAGLAWIALVAFTALLWFALPAATRILTPVWRGGQTDAVTSAEAPVKDETERLGDPAAAWSDFAPAFSSPWALPAYGWLLSGLDDEAEEVEAEDVDAELDTDRDAALDADDAELEDKGAPVSAGAEEVSSDDE